MNRENRQELARHGAFRKSSDSRQRHLERGDVRSVAAAKAKALAAIRAVFPEGRRQAVIGMCETIELAERALRENDLPEALRAGWRELLVDAAASLALFAIRTDIEPAEHVQLLREARQCLEGGTHT